ncbi:methyltransferase domain-containing protein [Paenibacillus sp. MMS20-IR301]|uniref:class I SAM-dependent methyltransferase n=1 Tax=Paenibacillus sp. MMS20-IR301 TaxID=2895946 RepID=UPI0028EDF30C|nr:methyltransferase domain-containing protein [Paenibacillus sp. MMS20-IR301]WNS46570.1 methyltransferase domain-containing protein [Paenibacillus sp. MMS20-IR301]
MLQDEMLMDPYTKDKLQLTPAGAVNIQNGQQYPWQHGYFVFLAESAAEGSNKKYLELYNRIARFYRLSNTLYFALKFGGERRYREQFLSSLALQDGDSILETSAGSADNFPYLGVKAELYGLDISSGMLKQAVRNLRRWKLEARLFQGQAEQLPFADNVFDCVYHVGGINYFSDPAAAVLEMIRVAKPGTKLMIADETEQLVKGTYGKVPVVKGYFQQKEQLPGIAGLIPQEMLELEYKEVCKGLMYCITFRKP